jgi:4-amino-4-deoxy-L-arabinose transferase-like glycosyltransferase
MAYNAVLKMQLSSSQTKTNGQQAKSKIGFAVLPVVLLFVFASALVADRLIVPQMPLSPDATAYAIIGHELLNGQTLYTDIWDHKPPVIYITYAVSEILFGYSAQTILLLNIFASLAVMFGLFYAGKAGRGRIVSGLWAAALWVISGTFETEARDPNTEVFINACVIWAFAILAKNRKKGFAAKHLIFLGFLFTLGSFFKPVFVAYAVFLMVAHVAFPHGGAANRKKALADALIIGAVGAIGWILMFGYFAATNRFELFYKTIVSYNSHYSGNILANIVAPLQGRSELFLDFMNPLAVCIIIGLIFTFIYNRRQAALLAAFAASTWIAIALPGRFYPHYFQLWVPPLIVGSSWAIGHFAVSEKLQLRLASFVAGVTLTVILIFNQISPYQSALAKDWTPFINPPLIAGEETARQINNLLTEDETFLVWGNTPNLYFLSGRKPPTAILFQQHLNESPVSELLINRVKADVARARPELLIVESGKPPAPDWIARYYEPIPIYQNKNTYAFYMRRGGRLAHQFNFSAAAK